MVEGGRPPLEHRHPEWWVYGGGAALAGVAGYVNTILLSIYHAPVSHMSGAVSTLGYDLESGNSAHVLQIIGMVGGFLAGAVASGVIVGGTTLSPGRRYGVALMVEAVLFAIGAWLVIGKHLAGLSFFAAGCGLQNGMASSYLGLILRTTHITGVVTDIGVLIGHWLRHRTVPGWKLLLLMALFIGFTGGGIIGAFAYHSLGLPALWIAAGGTFLAGLLYFLWRLRHRTEFAERE